MYNYKNFGVKFKKILLNSGTPVYLFSKKGAPVYVRALFSAGSKYDPIPGTAHFAEHMLVAGSKNFPDKNLLSREIEQIGGEFSASTSADFLRLNTEIAEAGDLPVLANLLQEMLVNSEFDKDKIEKERGAIISEVRSKKSNPKEYLWEVYRRLFFQGTACGNSVGGTEETIRQIEKENLSDYYKKFISSDRMIYIVSGDVDEKNLKTELEKITLKKSSNAPAKREILPIITENKTDIEVYDTDHVNFLLGLRTMTESLKERIALELFNTFLARGRSSRLINKLRYGMGLIYSTSGFYDFLPEWETWGVNISCSENNLDLVTKTALDEIFSLADNLTENELDFIKKKVVKNSFRGLQTSSAWVNMSEWFAVYPDDSILTDMKYLNETESITLEEVKRAAKKFIKKDNFLVATCGRSSIKPLLEKISTNLP